MKATLSFLTVIITLCSIAQAGESDFLFPKNFRWCVATAAHQIEGHNVDSDWWDWEQQPGRIKNGDRSGPACDHWNRVEEDTRLMQRLGVNTYRFSIEWAKIEPRPGHWNREAVEHYRQELKTLRRAGIAPLITLHHFTFPRWVREHGGWEWDELPKAFARFAVFALENIAPDTRHWITINEPMITLALGYMGGLQPPGRKGGIDDLHKPLVNMIRAHAFAYHAMKERFEELSGKSGATLRIGVAHHLRVFDPESSWSPIDSYLASRFDQAFNWAFLETLETGQLRYSLPMSKDVDESIGEAAGTQDFLGINYYSRDMVTFSFSSPGFKLGVPSGAPVSDVGWEIYPEGLYRILKETAKRVPGKPIVITENGIADANDKNRSSFLEAHLAAMARAMAEGVPVAGYCHWSLIDNFEWSEGFTPRFGLFEVDYKTFERRPRESAKRFAEIIRKQSP